jgi:hypothetical protein
MQDPPSPVELFIFLFPKTSQWISTPFSLIRSWNLWTRFPLRIRLLALVSTFSVIAAIVFLAIWFPRHSHDPDLWPKTVNFFVAWLPFAMSVFIAFIPDLERLGNKMRIASRVAIVVVGLIYSVFLWQQQSLTLDASRVSQRGAIQTSNKHTDDQIDALKKALQKDLKETGDKLADLVSKGTSTLGESIGKVKPGAPPELAKLQFSYDVTLFEEFPLVVKSMRPQTDGTFTIDFMVGNISNVPAKNGDIWVQICNRCKYAKEPDGFAKRSGSDEQIRHKNFQLINGGAFLEKMTVEINVPPEVGRFETAFEYACETCIRAKRWEQKIQTVILR